MNLTTKTAQIILKLRELDKNHNSKIGDFAIDAIISVKNELKEIIYNPSLDDLNTLAKIVELTKEIESVENGNM